MGAADEIEISAVANGGRRYYAIFDRAGEPQRVEAMSYSAATGRWSRRRIWRRGQLMIPTADHVIRQARQSSSLTGSR